MKFVKQLITVVDLFWHRKTVYSSTTPVMKQLFS